MAPQTSADLISALKGSLDNLCAALAGMSEADACKSPGAGRWSALECVEHLAIAEEGTLRRLQAGEPLAEPIHLPDREVRMAASVAGRANRLQAPPGAIPTGRFTTLADALQQLIAARARTIEFIEAHPDPRALQVMHPLFGPVSGYEFAAIMSSHSQRHALQIREIREAIK
jgi:hypothetical protein